MKVNPLVSVIVPNYNHQDFLEKRLESILNQTFKDFELILLDDCSTDNSRAILSKYSAHPKVSKVIFNETNTGNTFAQWNKGISLAAGEYIWIAESDDYCEADFLENLIPLIHGDKEVVLAYCQSKMMNEQGIVTGTWLNQTTSFHTDLFYSSFTMDGNKFIERFLVYKNVIPNVSAALIRKDVINSVGEVDTDPDLRHCGDWLFYLKILAGKKVAFFNTPLNYFRHHSSSVIATARKDQSIINLIDNDFFMREKMLSFYRIVQPPNLDKIIRNNNEVKKNYKYKKALFYLDNNRVLKGLSIMSRVPDVFLENLSTVKRGRKKINFFLKKFKY